MMSRSIVTCLLLATTAEATASCEVYHKVVSTTCAEACLNATVGICPCVLVIKGGHLTADSCKSVGFTVPNGTVDQKAGPCGKILFDNYIKPSSSLAAAAGGVSDLPLSTFDGAPKTTQKWAVTDDPVMGGRSHSTFNESDGVGMWAGTVAIVPFLHAPGFCTIRTGGVGVSSSFPDVSGTKKLKMMVRSNSTSILTEFSLTVETKGGVTPNGRQGTYSGNITIPNTGKWTEVESEWSNFFFEWRGEAVKGPKLMTQLNEITQIGLSTYFPGKVGTFGLEIKSFSAGN